MSRVRRAGRVDKTAAEQQIAGAQLFEIAFEVCHKLGGIYTVLRSKAPAMASVWGDRYCLIGPYHAETAEIEFEPRRPAGAFAAAIEVLQAAGVRCHYGRWLVSGSPRVLLLETASVVGKLEEMKYFLWEKHGLSLRGGDGELDEVVAMGYLVRDFLAAYCDARTRLRASGPAPVIAHCHEWMGALAIPLIREADLPVATVFTTHATLLGRYLSASHADLYAGLPYINPDESARYFNVEDRFGLERKACREADVFTTVSQVTAEEAGHLLGRQADILLPNGLNIQRFAAIHEFQNLHLQYKERINQFVMSHFFPSYSFPLEDTLYFFIAGRYEHRNKGADLFIDALARLNHRLIASGSKATVVAFIIMPAPFRSINVDVLHGRAMFEELRNVCEDIAESIGHQLLERTAAGEVPSSGDLLDNYGVIRLKRVIQARRRGLPPIIATHDLVHDGTDPVLCQLRACRLFNARSDRVKVVYHPEFLRSTGPLLRLDYDQFVRGCHLGVFPSYYEPWGYTPMECIASGIPAVTSDLAGFGGFLEAMENRPDEDGVYVVHRRGRKFQDSAEDLAEMMERFCGLTRRQRVEMRNHVESMAERFDWHRLIDHYTNAHALAVQRRSASMGV